jgi:hypothetical protein
MHDMKGHRESVALPVIQRHCERDSRYAHLLHRQHNAPDFGHRKRPIFAAKIGSSTSLSWTRAYQSSHRQNPFSVRICNVISDRRAAADPVSSLTVALQSGPAQAAATRPILRSCEASMAVRSAWMVKAQEIRDLARKGLSNSAIAKQLARIAGRRNALARRYASSEPYALAGFMPIAAEILASSRGSDTPCVSSRGV